MLSLFRIISLLEGLSFLLLLFVAMPIKYLLGQDLLVKLLGMPHGILFLIYIGFSFLVFLRVKWSFGTLLKVLLASTIPFGTFYIDHKYLRKS